MTRRKAKEMEFCKTVLEPLLEAIHPYIEDLRFRHGNMEFGKDFTFSYVNPLNRTINAGLQAKWGDITGSSVSILDGIIDQIRVAFKVPYKNKPGEELYLNELYVICSGKYRDNAIKIIENTLEKGFNVHFLNGSDIDKLSNKVALHRAKEERETRRALETLLEELDHNIRLARALDKCMEYSAEEREYFMLEYRLNCLEKVLELSVDNELIVNEANNLWDELTAQNNLLDSLRRDYEGKGKWQKETKKDLRNRIRRSIKEMETFAEYVRYFEENGKPADFQSP